MPWSGRGRSHTGLPPSWLQAAGSAWPRGWLSPYRDPPRIRGARHGATVLSLVGGEGSPP